MNRAYYGRVAALLGGMALVVTLTANAQNIVAPGSNPPPPKGPVDKVVAKATKLKQEDVDKVFKVLGPVVRDKLRAGEAVEIPGLGTFRVVRVEEHKDLVTGLPARIPPANYVEFIPNADLTAAANAPGVVPNVSVPPAEFVVNPNAAPGLKTEGFRTGRVRTR